jgi:hypothetical protein
MNANINSVTMIGQEVYRSSPLWLVSTSSTVGNCQYSRVWLLQCLLFFVFVVLAVASAQVLVSPGLYGVLPAALPAAPAVAAQPG